MNLNVGNNTAKMKQRDGNRMTITYDQTKRPPAPDGIPEKDWQVIDEKGFMLFNYIRTMFRDIEGTEQDNMLVFQGSLVRALIPTFRLLLQDFDTNTKRMAINSFMMQIEHNLIRLVGEDDPQK